MDAGADDYIQKNSLMLAPGVNVLPKLLESLICRINRKRGISFTDVPVER